MYGLGAVKTLGVRVGEELDKQISAATEKLGDVRYPKWNKSKVARQILEDFFNGTNNFRKALQAAAGENVKQNVGRQNVKQNVGRQNVKQKRRRKR